MIDRRRKTKDRYDLLIDGLFRIYEKALRIRFHWLVEARAPKTERPKKTPATLRECSERVHFS